MILWDHRKSFASHECSYSRPHFSRKAHKMWNAGWNFRSTFVGTRQSLQNKYTRAEVFRWTPPKTSLHRITFLKVPQHIPKQGTQNASTWFVWVNGALHFVSSVWANLLNLLIFFDPYTRNVQNFVRCTVQSTFVFLAPGNLALQNGFLYCYLCLGMSKVKSLGLLIL